MTTPPLPYPFLSLALNPCYYSLTSYLSSYLPPHLLPHSLIYRGYMIGFVTFLNEV